MPSTENKRAFYRDPRQADAHIGVQHGAPWASASFINGENASNPLAGPPDTTSGDRRGTDIGGLNRPQIRSLDEPEHALGARMAKGRFVGNPLKNQ